MEKLTAVRVYANAKKFVVIPLIGEAEVTPAQQVHLTIGRPIAYTLARALESARNRSTSTGDIVAWDGENGTWWAHHLLHATITWSEHHIRVVPDEGRPARHPQPTVATFPTDTATSQIAEWLIRQLGERLT
jgi:hypothetical protein